MSMTYQHDGKIPAWWVHVYGPDDLLPFSTEMEALRNANEINQQFVAIRNATDSPYLPTFVAVVHRESIGRIDPRCPACRPRHAKDDEIHPRDAGPSRRASVKVCDVVRTNEDGSADRLGEIRSPHATGDFDVPTYDMGTGKFVPTHVDRSNSSNSSKGCQPSSDAGRLPPGNRRLTHAADPPSPPDAIS